jgi:hypothetical protein
MHSYDTTIDQFIIRYKVCNLVFTSVPLGQLNANSTALQYQSLITILYAITTSLIKISILSFLRRLFNTSRKWDFFFYFLYFCYIGLLIAIIFNTVFMCKPRAAIFDLRVYAATGGKCQSFILESIIFSAVFATSDVVLLVIPLVVVFKMNIRTKRKISMIFIFALGGLSCIFCIWKAAYLSVVVGNFDDACKCSFVRAILISTTTNRTYASWS